MDSKVEILHQAQISIRSQCLRKSVNSYDLILVCGGGSVGRCLIFTRRLWVRGKVVPLASLISQFGFVIGSHRTGACRRLRILMIPVAVRPWRSVFCVLCVQQQIRKCKWVYESCKRLSPTEKCLVYTGNDPADSPYDNKAVLSASAHLWIPVARFFPGPSRWPESCKGKIGHCVNVIDVELLLIHF